MRGQAATADGSPRLEFSFATRMSGKSRPTSCWHGGLLGSSPANTHLEACKHRVVSGLLPLQGCVTSPARCLWLKEATGERACVCISLKHLGAIEIYSTFDSDHLLQRLLREGCPQY